MRVCSLFALLATASASDVVTGCTDSTANNYNPAANYPGSCDYGDSHFPYHFPSGDDDSLLDIDLDIDIDVSAEDLYNITLAVASVLSDATYCQDQVR